MLALPLAALVVYLVLSRRRGSRFALVPAILALWAVIASHHLTPLLLIGAFVVWALVELFLRRGRPSSVGALLVMVAAGVVAVLALHVITLEEINPLRRTLSQYALGPWKPVFDAGVLAVAAGSGAGRITEVAPR